MEDIETNIVMDVPKDGEFHYESLFWSEDSQDPKEFLPPSIQNQGLKKITRMACSRYGMTHAVNAQNKAVQWVDWMRFYEIPAEGQWENYLKVNPNAEHEGATLQSAIDQFIDLGYITGYSRLNTISDMKASLNNTRPIYTGSQVWDWQFVTTDHKYRVRTDGRICGHCFCIVGYNNSWWVAINSYGQTNGVFYIPYDLTDTLFSRYSISDSRDTEVFNNLK